MALSMSGTLLVALAFGGVSFFLPRFLISPMSKFKTDKRVGVDDKQTALPNAGQEQKSQVQVQQEIKIKPAAESQQNVPPNEQKDVSSSQQSSTVNQQQTQARMRSEMEKAVQGTVIPIYVVALVVYFIYKIYKVCGDRKKKQSSETYDRYGERSSRRSTWGQISDGKRGKVSESKHGSRQSYDKGGNKMQNLQKQLAEAEMQVAELTRMMQSTKGSRGESSKTRKLLREAEQLSERLRESQSSFRKVGRSSLNADDTQNPLLSGRKTSRVPDDDYNAVDEWERDDYDCIERFKTRNGRQQTKNQDVVEDQRRQPTRFQNYTSVNNGSNYGAKTGQATTSESEGDDDGGKFGSRKVGTGNRFASYDSDSDDEEKNNFGMNNSKHKQQLFRNNLDEYTQGPMSNRINSEHFADRDDRNSDSNSDDNDDLDRNMQLGVRKRPYARKYDDNY